LFFVQWLLSNRQDETDDDKSHRDRINSLPGRPINASTFPCLEILRDTTRLGDSASKLQIEAKGSDTVQRQWICTMDRAFGGREGGESDAAELQLWHDPRWPRPYCKWFLQQHMQVALTNTVLLFF